MPERLDPIAYLQAVEASIPQLAETVGKLRDLFEKKWWHELSLELVAFMATPECQPMVIDVYQNVVVIIRADISASMYLRLIIVTITCIEDTKAALDLIADSSATLLASDQQGYHSSQCIRAILLMTNGSVTEAKKILNAADEFMATLENHEVLPIFHAMLHKSQARCFELNKDYGAFYKSVFSMLSYANQAEVPLLPAELQAVAYKAAIAALLAKDVYNFGQLLMCTAFVKALEDSGEGWLLEWVRLCNAGDVAGHDRFTTTSKPRIAAISDLANALPQIVNKVRLMALLHFIFHLPADQRVVSFNEIAERCCVKPDEVEPMVLKAFALHLIEGTVDGVEKKVETTWVQSRHLEMNEIKALRDRIAAWRTSVKSTSGDVSKMAEGVTM